MADYLSPSVLACALLVAGCASSRDVGEEPDSRVVSAVGAHETLNATAWMQLSAEYRAVALQAYRMAGARLGEALADSSWSALPGQTSAHALPSAVILDVDETVLDNSPFQARLIIDDTVYSRGAWNEWVREERAGPIPGAREFTRTAAEAGVVVFYVTNRSADLEEATRANLQALGFPVREGIDVLLTRGERSDWTGDKETRRSYVGEQYRVLLLVGDDLNDFVTTDGRSVEERERLVDRTSGWWGERWIVLPNPVYGSWERTLNQEAGGGDRAAQIRARTRSLRTQ